MLTFRVFWAVDAILAAIAVGFFLIGLGDGSVSAFNIGIWLLLLLVLGLVLGGSLWLHSRGRDRLAMAVVTVLAIPGILLGLFFLVLIIAQPNWH